jgi:NAD(P)-dependent dehydrogenase (short-subunit alcohol dehydrogenase family)
MRTIVITGSASGIGAALRRRLELDGCRVVGVDLQGQEVAADLSTPTGRSAAMNKVLDLTGRSIDGLVVAAGVGPQAPQGLQVRVNYFGAVEVLDGLRPALAAGERAAAVCIASNSIGLTPLGDTTLVDEMLRGSEGVAAGLAGSIHGALVYAMTKVALTRAMRRRVQPWGDAGLRLNAVAPGPVSTPMLEAILDDEELGDAVDALPIPLGRRAEPEEIASVVAFLLRPEASFVHGSVLFADGGSDAFVRPDVV